MSITEIDVQIEERLPLMGYAHWTEEGRAGRVFWSVDPVSGEKKHRLSMSANRGLPSDEALKKIRRALIAYVQDGNRPPALVSAIVGRD